MSQRDAPELTDLLCESCGYVLNGLPGHGNCPECGEPIEASTTRSLRALPDWERDRHRARTFIAALRVRFYRELLIRSDSRQSRRFALICLALASLANAITVAAHYVATLWLSAPPAWLPPIPVIVLVGPFVVLGIWWSILELIAYLTSAEGQYRGLRLTRDAVRRVLHYLTIHVLLASTLVLLIPLTYVLLLRSDLEFGLYMVEYLFTLSAAVILAAFYLFRIYWAAMKAIMFASRVETKS